MATLTIELPTMYGDHHVTEVRRILFELPGVEDIYASSSFHQVQVTYDSKKTTKKEITETLEKAGYLGELPIGQETNKAVSKNGDRKSFRHTTTNEHTKQIGFMRETNFSGRPLWPCPGIGPLPRTED